MKEIKVKQKAKRYSLLFASLLLLAATQNCYAQKKTFTRDYTYRASDSDSKLTARKIAIQEMQTLLLMEIGQALQSEQVLKKLSVTKDGKETFSESFSQEVRAITAGFVEMKIIEEEWDGKFYYIAARMSVDTKEVSQRVAEALSSKQKGNAVEVKAAPAGTDAEKRVRELEAQKKEMVLKKELARLKELEAKELARKKELEALKRAYFYSYRFSLTARYGFLFGVCKRWGGYTQYSESLMGVWENSLSKTTYNGESNRSYFRSSFTAGGMVRPVPSWNWFLYAGAGYGKYGAAYSEYGYSSGGFYCPTIIKGLELEGGVTVAYKFLSASMGYSTIEGLKVKELHFGLGVKF